MTNRKLFNFTNKVFTASALAAVLWFIFSLVYSMFDTLPFFIIKGQEVLETIAKISFGATLVVTLDIIHDLINKDDEGKD